MWWKTQALSHQILFLISVISTLLLPISISISIFLYPNYPENENLSSLGARSPALSNVTKKYVQPPFPEVFNISIMIAAIGLMISLPILRHKLLKGKAPTTVISSINGTQAVGFAFLFLLGIFDLGYIRSIHDLVATYLFYFMMITYLQIGILLGIKREKIYRKWNWMLMVVIYLFLISIQRQLSMWKFIDYPYYLSNGPYQKLWGIGFISILLLEIKGLWNLDNEKRISNENIS